MHKYKHEVFNTSIRKEYMGKVFHRRLQYEFRSITLLKYRHEIFNTSIRKEYTDKVFHRRLKYSFTPKTMLKYRI